MGRNTIDKSGELAKQRTVRLTDTHHEKLLHVGMAALRRWLDKVKLPREGKS